LIAKPLKEVKILSDCRAALGLKAGLKEIIFATSAPDDTGASDAAIAVERTLRAEGHDLKVVVYGWGALQTLIALHEAAYNAFFPSAVATSAAQPAAVPHGSSDDFATQVAAQVVEQLRLTGLTASPPEASGTESAQEDPALHAKIDTFRDLFKEQQQPLIAEKGLLALLEKEVLEGKPWARFRIETNLGSIALDLGREGEGATRFEAAHALLPDNPNGIANLALARTIQGRFSEAMDLAKTALAAQPRADHAVGYLLQAAARSDWQGEPETFIPPDLVGSSHADLGLAEFLRRRDLPGWAERSLQFARKHTDVPEFKRIGAIAILSLAIETGSIVPGGLGPVTAEELDRAAEDMKAVAEQCIDFGYADQHDLICYLNNAAVLLRLAGRQAECEALVRRGLPLAPDDPHLRRLLALAQAAQGRPDDGLATLAGQSDPENRLIAAEMLATRDVAKALDEVLAIDPSGIGQRLAQLRWRLAGEFALKAGDEDRLKEAVDGLQTIDPADVTAELLKARWDHKTGVEEVSVQRRLKSVFTRVRHDADMVTRYILANELRDFGLPEEAASLLQNHIDLQRLTPGATLYLQCLAAARRDEAFRSALADAGPAVRDDPDILWTAAAHAWNIGDLEGAEGAINRLLAQEPENPSARLLKVEILVRQNRSTDLLAELDKAIEDLPFRRLKDRFRVASMLGHFGYMQRAAAQAYRLFLENRDNSQAWMTLSVLVLEEGRGEESGSRAWDTPIVSQNAAVNVRYDDAEELFVVIEPDADLRRLDNESWEPEHPLVRTLTGMKAGDRFTDPSGREGTITQLRHKYVARLHFVMKNHEARFPEIMGFRSVSLNVEQPGGLDEFIQELKARHDWFEEEQEKYRNGPWPIGVLAHRLGLDTIEVAVGLASQDQTLKVALGNEPERIAAAAKVRENARKGCVLDLLAFWTGWRLNALDAVAGTCGPISLPQSVVDRLRARREKIQFSIRDGLRSARYDGGKIAATEIAPEVVQTWLDDIDQAIAWVEANAIVCPLVAGEDLPPALRDHLRTGGTDLFDSVVVAMQQNVLLITDDLPTREFGRALGLEASTWLHQVFSVAADQSRIDFDTYVRWSANLVDAGHSYIGVDGQALARSFRLDSECGEAPGHLFKSLSTVIGGRGAEPRSHVFAVLGCLRELWSDSTTSAFRQAATGLLLRQLVRERTTDYAMMLRAVLRYVGDLPELVAYMHAWARGHFLSDVFSPAT
jgi:predicted Zn-dependent protease